jgi:CBS domain-containing protein
MRLGELMTRDVKTCQEWELARDAHDKMRLHHVHHLVVVDGVKLQGLISERDLHGALPRDASVGDLMLSPVITASPETTVREAANLMRGRSIGCLPIVKDARLVGIVTVTDLLELLGKGTTMPFPRSKPGRRAAPAPRNGVHA